MKTFREFFKGYVTTKNKKCTRKFKDAPLSTYDEISFYDEFAGILASDTILVDIDDSAESEILAQIVEDLKLNCTIMFTTRGRHFYFENTTVEKCYTGCKLALGIKADIKVGVKNSYAVLKYQGKERELEYDYVSDETGEYDKLPNFLLPVKTDIDLFNLEEGEGRNSTLYKYILTLLNEGFEKEEIRNTLRLINKYVFKTPLSESELEVILRDDAFPEQDEEVFFDKKGFHHEKFGDWLISKYHIIRLNGLLASYQEGMYKSGNRYIENAMIQKIPNLKASLRTEVLKYIEARVLENSEGADAKYILFKNGIYDIETNVLSPSTPDLVIPNMINFNFNPNAYSEVVDRTLNKIACGNQEVRLLLEEAIGYGFYRRNELSKAFILTGNRANGKSTFLDMIIHLYGEDNVSSLDLIELDSRFSIAELADKIANIGDDISDEFLQGEAIAKFKKIVSGNMIKGEMKGENPFKFKPYCKLFFSANQIPRMKDKTGAVLRRLVIIPFNATFSKEDADYDPYIISKLKTNEAMEYLIKLGLEGLKRILYNYSFTESEEVNRALEDYEIENNPILYFLNEVPLSEILNEKTDVVYRRYKVFCLENGYTEMTKASFTKELSRRCGIETKVSWIKGKSIRIYCKI